MPAARVTSFQAIDDLSHAIEKFAPELREVWERVESCVYAVLEKLVEQREQLKRELEQLQTEASSSSGDSEDGDNESDSNDFEIRETEEAIEAVSRKISYLEDKIGEFKRIIQRLDTLTNEETPKALGFIKNKLEQLEKYSQVKIGSSPGSGLPAVIPPGVPPAIIPEKPLIEMPLPADFEWVFWIPST